MAKPPRVTKFAISGDRYDNVIDGSTYATDIQERGLIISGNDGNDTLKGGLGQDVLQGGNGNDTLIADLSDLQGVSAGTVVYDGGKGVDTLDLSGIDYVDGAGVWIQFNNGFKPSNFLRTDVLYSHGSLDVEPVTYTESFGNNFTGIENFILGDGNDLIQLLNVSGNNRIDGGGGDDHIWAGDGADVVDGGAGDDLISGGWGSDTMTGGQGNDIFAFTGWLSGENPRDTIMDFDLLIDGSDPSHDTLWLWDDHTIDWDENSGPDALRGFVMEGSTVLQEIILLGVSIADVSSIVIRNVDPSTGDPF